MVELKVRKVGSSLGVLLPKNASEALGVDEGDRLFLTESPDGMRISRFDPDFERRMKLAEKGMKRYDNALKRLAK